MTSQRELLYRCTFSSTHRTSVAHVAAWDAREAIQLFSAELADDGVGERGTIEVESLEGTLSEQRRAAYRPTN
jgi:hypothetical protein